MAVLVSKQIKVPSLGKKASDYAVGERVYIPVNGTNTEFLVVHQGNPDSSIYSTTFNNGTILLMKDLYENRQWHSSDVNDYANSTLHSYLNNGFLALFDANIRSVIKQVKVPYRKGSGTSKTVTSGENGLSAKIFLLSMTEVGFSESYQPTSEGAKLSYFESGTGTSAKNKRIAYLNGSATDWWLRSPNCDYSDISSRVTSNGIAFNNGPSFSYGVRPALVVNSDTLFDPNTNIIKG